jgi:oxygen-independent coproporphyrinogen-3 oxidase
VIEEAGSRLRENDFYPYYLYRQKEVAGGLENTGFARPGQACVYNVAMMSDRFDVIGLGSGAISKRVDGTRVRRSPNSKDLLNYQQRIEELAHRKIDLFIQ